MEYASKGLGVTGATLGGVALGTSLLGGGNLLGNLLGVNNCGNGDNMPVSRYDAGKDAQIARLETEVKLRDANTFTMSEMGKLRDYVDAKFDGVNAQLCQQNVYNATNTAAISCMQGQIGQLMSLTKCVIPTTSICPEPMLKYNSWTAPTTTTTG